MIHVLGAGGQGRGGVWWSLYLFLKKPIKLVICAVGWSAVCDCGISWSYSLTLYIASVSMLI